MDPRQHSDDLRDHRNSNIFCCACNGGCRTGLLGKEGDYSHAYDEHGINPLSEAEEVIQCASVLSFYRSYHTTYLTKDFGMLLQ